jgi:hypothetical protein
MHIAHIRIQGKRKKLGCFALARYANLCLRDVKAYKNITKETEDTVHTIQVKHENDQVEGC